MLETVTLTAGEVVTFPAASRALADSECVPFDAPTVFQEIAYGAAVSSAPRLAPSSRNCTPATPTLSEALAETVTVPETVAPAAGAVIETVGGTESGARVVALAVAESAETFPAASRARTAYT